MPPALQLDVESLRTLIATLDHGGMTRAAERLGVTQSAVSWKIKRLEQRIGRPLLIRDGHQLRPTRDARALLDEARELVAIHDRLAARLSSSELTGMVRLGSNEEIDPVKMARLLGRFAWSHPHVRVEFVIDSTVRLTRALADNTVDVAMIQVVPADLREDDVVLWSDQLRWVTSWDDPDRYTSPVPLVTFGEHCFYNSISEPALTAAGIEHSVAFAVSSSSAHRAAIVAGLGVGVLGERYLDDEIVEWPPGRELPDLPTVHQLARTVPGQADEVTDTLVAAIRAELLDPAVATAAA
ncbi:LysR family transcriptional regulator [Ilumatobacter sp.]|uniref:LysR family transcriptional regulator n=1 Tax=Ilumatobacter sp. TaxID=1967498 RepID=UPI003B525397